MLSFFGNIIGALVVAEWFPGRRADRRVTRLQTFASTSGWSFGLPQLIAVIGVILGVWLFNMFGVKPSLAVGYVTGALLMIPLVIISSCPISPGIGKART